MISCFKNDSIYIDILMFFTGGYDRSECLKTSEMFDSNSNKWIPLSDMTVQRGRFSVASVGGFIYAVGGSDGLREQRALEYYDPVQKMWIENGEARNAKVSQGINISTILQKISNFIKRMMFCIKCNKNTFIIDSCTLF